MSEETILVVEDNDITRQGLKIMLERGGFNVLTAINGVDALGRMRSTCPDLILSDIAMPEMDGYTLFDEVRNSPEWVTIPFIFLTARDSREDIYRGKKSGAEDYLVKPVESQELLTTIRSRLNRSQQLLLAQLEHAYRESLIVFSNAIELRDLYTHGHVERVMEISVLIAHTLGISEGQASALRLGSILHDIGNIHIRENILNKPGPLDAVEWQEVRQHPVVGAQMVINIPYLAVAVPVIRCHHERWDGSGYPDGLIGEQIPTTARIVSVADALDVMTHPRVYKDPLNLPDAYQEILDGSGNRYDPEVIRAFKFIWPRIRNILD